jgi:hypothetical protein
LNFPTDNSIANIPFDAVIPVNDFLALQIFDDWPQRFGSLILKLKMSKKSQVVAQVCPHEVAKTETFTNESISDEALRRILNTHFKYDRKFVQAGLPINVITHIGPDPNNADRCVYTVEEVIFDIDEIEFTTFTASIAGYNVADHVKQVISTLYPPQNPLVIPSEMLLVLNMPRSGNDRKYSEAMSHVLNNVTDIIPVFYQDSRQLTCVENPMIDNFQLNVAGRLVPEMRLCTVGPQFMNLVLQSADLDGLHEASNEFEASLVIPMNNDDGTPILRTITDQTSFLPVLQVERSGKGYFYDGLETGNTPRTIKMDFTPIHPGENDTYLFRNPTAPQLWFVRDTYWTWDNHNGLIYHETGTPPKYASDIVG